MGGIHSTKKSQHPAAELLRMYEVTRTEGHVIKAPSLQCNSAHHTALLLIKKKKKMCESCPAHPNVHLVTYNTRPPRPKTKVTDERRTTTKKKRKKGRSKLVKGKTVIGQRFPFGVHRGDKPKRPNSKTGGTCNFTCNISYDKRTLDGAKLHLSWKKYGERVFCCLHRPPVSFPHEKHKTRGRMQTQEKKINAASQLVLLPTNARNNYSL